MDTFRSDGKGNIYPVIDNQGNAMGLSKLVQLLCSLDQDSSVAVLVSILNNGDACVQIISEG